MTGLLENLHTNLAASIKEYEENGYPYDFYITSVSGVFSDNAPINPAIADTVALFNEKYGEEVTMHMVTLQELYDKIRDKVQDAPVYRGAINDWWGNGVGSTPYAVKHYKEAVRLNHICDRLEEKTGVHNKELIQAYGDNSLLYAEHTWGHSATVTNPYDTMVTNLDMRKNSYASKAHEAAAMRKNEQCHKLFYPQLGVKLCSMAGGGVQKIYMVFLREPSRRDRSGSDLFHLRDGFEIKMNFDRNVSCFIFVNAFMHDDFFD